MNELCRESLIDYSWFLDSVLGSYKTVFVNEGTWFVSKSVSRETPNEKRVSFKGYVYALEYGDMLKIGSTQNVRSRIQAISAQARKYSNIITGEFCFSEAHIEYRANERILHKAFADKRIKGTELFRMTLDDFLRNQPVITMSEDDTEVRESSREHVVSLMKSLGLTFE